MRILALDLALSTGWAFGDSFASAQVGVWTLPGYSDRDLPRTLGGIYSSVLACSRANNIEGGVIEAALRGVKRTNSRGFTTPSSAWGDRCLTMLNGAARAGMANAGVRLLESPAPSTWRKAILGEGFPKNPKEKAVEHCARNGRPGLPHDAAEALCILQYKLDELGLLSRVKG